MPDFLRNALLFSLFALAFYVVALFIWSPTAPALLRGNVNYRIGSDGHLYTRLAEARNHGEVDILFIGSSHAFRGFDTRIFAQHGYRSFNLGSSAQTPLQTKVLLNRYLDRFNPRIIIYEVYPSTFNFDGVESSLDLIANDRNDEQSLQMALTINNVKTYNTLLYGYVRDLLGVNASFTEPIQKKKDTYVPGGYVEREVGHYAPVPFKRQEIVFNDYQIASFSETVQMIKERGIELILVYAPIARVYYDSYENTPYFDSTMRTFATYYNFNEMLTLNDSLHFYDADHLNQAGVEIFDQALIERLKP